MSAISRSSIPKDNIREEISPAPIEGLRSSRVDVEIDIPAISDDTIRALINRPRLDLDHIKALINRPRLDSRTCRIRARRPDISEEMKGYISPQELMGAFKHCNRKYRKCKLRLFVGEASFSFTEAYLNKHKGKPLLPKAIVATELDVRLSPTTEERIQTLRDRSVTIRANVDATKLHLHPELKDKTFKRIHWNFPYASGKYEESNGTEGKTSKAVAGFFLSARRLQKTGGRIHITLAQPQGQREWRQDAAYGIVKASKAADYALVAVRNFGAERYPGYKHQQTKDRSQSAKAADFGKEFIFQKRRDAQSESEASLILNSAAVIAADSENLLAGNLLSAHILTATMALTPATRESSFCLSSLEDLTRNLTKKLNESKALLDSASTLDIAKVRKINRAIKKASKLTSIPQEIHPMRSREREYFPYWGEETNDSSDCYESSESESDDEVSPVARMGHVDPADSKDDR